MSILQRGKFYCSFYFKKYPNKIYITYEHFPLSIHENAFIAAVAAECASMQNNFENYHELLFLNQMKLDDIDFDSLAYEAGIKNITSFNRCVDSEKTASIVYSGLNLSEKLGIAGIPTFIINGKLYSGVLTEHQFDNIIKEVLSNN